MFRFLKRLFAEDEKPTIAERVTAAQRSPPKRVIAQRSLKGNADVLAIRDAADLISYPNHMLYDLWKTGKFTQHHVKLPGRGRKQRAVSILELEAFEKWVKSANGFTPETPNTPKVVPSLVQVPNVTPSPSEPPPLIYRQKHDKTCPFCKRVCGGSGYPPHIIKCARKEIRDRRMSVNQALLVLRATPAGHLFEGDTPQSGFVSGKYSNYYLAFEEHRKGAK